MPDALRLVTDRLVLAPFDPAVDWRDFVADLVLDPIVTRYWADFSDPSLDAADKEQRAAAEFLPWFEEGSARGLVAWTLRTPDGDFVGVSGLTIPGPPVSGPDPEFGCMLATRWHGQGLATESGRAILADAWSRLGLRRIITVMDSPNPASRRLVDKLGFRFDAVVFDEDGRPFIRFVVEPAGPLTKGPSAR